MRTVREAFISTVLLVLAWIFFLVAAGMIVTSPLWAQNPQTQTAPLYGTNSRWVNGVAPGYYPLPGSGLNLSIGAGTSFCATMIVTYAGGSITLADNTTNYVYLDTGASCAPASNTTGFSSSTIPLAVVVTSGGGIITVTDDRTFFTPAGTGGTGLSSLNGLTATSQTFATGTAGTDFNIASAGSIHTFNFPDASSTARGLLTSTDWSTFNGKASISGTPTAGNCVSWLNSTTVQDEGSTCGGAGSSIFTSFQVGTNTPITGSGKYFQLAAGSNVTLGFTGSGTSGSPYVATINSSGGGGSVLTISNDGTTGTTANTLTKVTGAPATAIIASTSDTGGVVGITTSGAGTTGSATIQISGQVSCTFDGATTSGDYVQISSTTAGNCHDSGSTYPTSSQVVGRVLSTNASGGTYQIDLFPAEIRASNVTSVGMTGDGVVLNSTVPGSPVTSSGTLAPTLANASVGNVLAGPIGNLGSNVGVRQYVVCQSTTSTITCPSFGSPLAVGDSLYVVVPQYTSSTATISDSLLNSITASDTTGSGAASRVGFGSVTTGGSDTVTVTGANPFSACSGSDYAAVAFDLTGASALSAADATQSNGNVGSFSVAVSAAASTDSFIRLGLTSPTSGSCGVSNGSLTISPIGSTLGSLTNSNVANGWGSFDIFAPGSTSSVSNAFSYVLSSGSGSNNRIASIVGDIAQSAGTGRAPWVARRLVESDLPSSAVSAIQSVADYVLSSNFTLTAGSDNTVLSQSITMPSDGCPCRVQVSYTAFLKATSAAQPWDVWISDGTSDFAQWEMQTTSASEPNAARAQYSPNSYSNNQSVTFTLHVQTDASATGTSVQAAPAAPASGQHSGFQLSVLQSRN